MPDCPSENTDMVDQSGFWDSGGVDWDCHRVGWAIAGGFTAVVRPLFTSFFLSELRICNVKKKIADCPYYLYICVATLSVRISHPPSLSSISFLTRSQQELYK